MNVTDYWTLNITTNKMSESPVGCVKLWGYWKWEQLDSGWSLSLNKGRIWKTLDDVDDWLERNIFTNRPLVDILFDPLHVVQKNLWFLKDVFDLQEILCYYLAKRSSKCYTATYTCPTLGCIIHGHLWLTEASMMTCMWHHSFSKAETVLWTTQTASKTICNENWQHKSIQVQLQNVVIIYLSNIVASFLAHWQLHGYELPHFKFKPKRQTILNT